MQSYIKNRVKLWEQIEFKGQKSVSTVFLGTLTDFRCICTVFIYRNENLQNESLPKDPRQELFIVNSSV